MDDGGAFHEVPVNQGFKEVGKLNWRDVLQVRGNQFVQVEISPSRPEESRSRDVSPTVLDEAWLRQVHTPEYLFKQTSGNVQVDHAKFRLTSGAVSVPQTARAMACRSNSFLRLLAAASE